MLRKLVILFGCFFCLLGCNIQDEENRKAETKYKTENVIVIVVDGPRYSETWGDTTHQYIPFFSNIISKSGIVNTEFYNHGKTSTIAGFTAITTGVYQEMNNKGKELPKYPSIFQYFIKKNNKQSFFSFETVSENKNAWIINSKHKLKILDNCENKEWSGKYLPSLDSWGNRTNKVKESKLEKLRVIKRIKSKNRNDTLTLKSFFNIMSEHHPKLTLLGFHEPDLSGHDNSWKNYLQGIIDTDKYIYKIWQYIQNDSYYKGNTTLFITNDHGRHLDGIKTGFKDHGDGCPGCRHVNFFAFGPDFQTGIIDVKRELIDIPATIAELLQFDGEYIEGKVMYELFNQEDK